MNGNICNHNNTATVSTGAVLVARLTLGFMKYTTLAAALLIAGFALMNA